MRARMLLVALMSLTALAVLTLLTVLSPWGVLTVLRVLPTILCVQIADTIGGAFSSTGGVSIISDVSCLALSAVRCIRDMMPAVRFTLLADTQWLMQRYSVSNVSMIIVPQGWRYLNGKSLDAAFLPVSETCKNFTIEKRNIKEWTGKLLF